jgi:hypothetical protein
MPIALEQLLYISMHSSTFPVLIAPVQRLSNSSAVVLACCGRGIGLTPCCPSPPLPSPPLFPPLPLYPFFLNGLVFPPPPRGFFFSPDPCFKTERGAGTGAIDSGIAGTRTFDPVFSLLLEPAIAHRPSLLMLTLLLLLLLDLLTLPMGVGGLCGVCGALSLSSYGSLLLLLLMILVVSLFSLKGLSLFSFTLSFSILSMLSTLPNISTFSGVFCFTFFPLLSLYGFCLYGSASYGSPESSGKKEDIADGVELELDSTGVGAAVGAPAARQDFKKFSKLCNRGSKNLKKIVYKKLDIR